MDSDCNQKLYDRILLDLKNVFDKCPLIDEFGILPVFDSVQNKSPVILIENKLALECWCVESLYLYVYNKFFDSRLKRYKVDSNTLLLWTCAILLINPELDAAWNSRKEICNSLKDLNNKTKISYSSLLKNELKFSELVLSRKPKSSPTFSHRKWILLKMKEIENISPEIIRREFLVCTNTANSYANNYYAWSHRSWIIKELLQSCMKTVSEELSETEKWASTHVSEHSGYHYRQFLLSCCSIITSINSSNCILHKLDNLTDNDNSNCHPHLSYKQRMLHLLEKICKELNLLSNLQTDYPGHESLWYHRRYLLYEYKKIGDREDVCPVNNESLEDSLQIKRHKSECEFNLTWDLESEDYFLDHCIAAANNKSWERTLILRHLKWLNNVLLWPISTELK